MQDNKNMRKSDWVTLLPPPISTNQHICSSTRYSTVAPQGGGCGFKTFCRHNSLIFPFHFPTHFPLFLVVYLPHAYTTHAHTHMLPPQQLTLIDICTCTCTHYHLHQYKQHTVHASWMPAFTHTNTQTQMCLCTCTTILTPPPPPPPSHSATWNVCPE